ncbi:hypothetical protein KSP40_PGU013203 [Platanthera guangdongensis]|uniref:Uncharacterized protein n=1 Tax=Platanthera guangdongensis TaxID=2320717 RepID=A0ABR2LLY2_9ASPA
MLAIEQTRGPPEFTAEHVLPLLFPLLLAQQLSVQQFAQYMIFVKDILRKIEGKRGVTLTEFRTSEAKASPSLSNELHSESYQKLRGPVPAVKKSTSWDEDWGTTLSTQSTTNHFHRQQTASDHPVDVDWQPQKFSSSFASQSLVEGELKRDYGDHNIDDIDPFANWPHRLNDSVASLGSIYMPSGSSVHARNNNAIGLKPYQGTVGINQSNTNSFLMGSSSLASLSSSTGNVDSLFFRLGYPNSTSSQLIAQKGSDMGSNFVSTDKGHTTPKIRPPPDILPKTLGPIRRELVPRPFGPGRGANVLAQRKRELFGIEAWFGRERFRAVRAWRSRPTVSLL